MSRPVKIVLGVLIGLFAWFAVATLGNLLIRASIPGYQAAEPSMSFTTSFPWWYHATFLVSLAPLALIGGALAPRRAPQVQAR
jgi:hypothetical protein